MTNQQLPIESEDQFIENVTELLNDVFERDYKNHEGFYVAKQIVDSYEVEFYAQFQQEVFDREFEHELLKFKHEEGDYWVYWDEDKDDWVKEKRH